MIPFGPGEYDMMAASLPTMSELKVQPIDTFLEMIRIRYHDQRKRNLTQTQYLLHLNNAQANLRRAVGIDGNPATVLVKAVDMAVYALFAAERYGSFKEKEKNNG